MRFSSSCPLSIVCTFGSFCVASLAVMAVNRCRAVRPYNGWVDHAPASRHRSMSQLSWSCQLHEWRDARYDFEIKQNNQ